MRVKKEIYFVEPFGFFWSAFLFALPLYLLVQALAAMAKGERRNMLNTETAQVIG
ncbi:MAG: hypothetical protein MK212_03400 [Saprospiraceae bacterium]|nr:hypothetical protein [Saprospiraceae bacterium]